MAKLPVLEIDPTLVAVDDGIAARHNLANEPRIYLGMSTIGQDCKRAVWYGFRWAAREVMTAESVRRIQDGHAGEAIMAARLHATPGIKLHTHDVNGKQFGFADHGGHFGGHMDGAIHGVVQAPATWHVWEHKVVGEKGFKEFSNALSKFGSKGALVEWSATYYAQAQLYMHYSGMARHYLTVDSAGSRKSLSCRTEPDKPFAARVIAIAKGLIDASEPPARIADDATKFPCGWCTHATHCHGARAPAMNCRTCVHSTALTDRESAVWTCAKYGEISVAKQRVGCDDHRFIPSLIAYAEPIDADDVAVTYRHRKTSHEFKNGIGGWSSRDLSNLDESFASDNFVRNLVDTFDGAHVIESVA